MESSTANHQFLYPTVVPVEKKTVVASFQEVESVLQETQNMGRPTTEQAQLAGMIATKSAAA